MLPKPAVTLLLLLCLAAPAVAGEKGGADHGDIAGVVRDAFGKPVAGVTVRWEYAEFMEEAKSDKAGRYRFANVPYPDVDVIAFGDKRTQPRVFLRLAGRGRTRELDLQLIGWNLTATVKGSEGFEGVLRTSAKPEAAIRPLSAVGQRAKNGGLLFRASPGPYELWLKDKEGEHWLVERRDLTAKHSVARRKLVPGRIVRGRILGANGKGVVAELVFRREGGVPAALDGPELRRVMSTKGGRFRSRPLPPGEWSVTIKAKDSSLGVTTVKVPKEGGVDVTLAPARTITLIANEALSKAMNVRVEGPLGLELVRTDDPKVLTLRGLPPGSESVLRVTTREATRRCAVVPIVAKDGVTEIEFKLSKAPVVSGIMTLDGKPLPEHSELYFWRELDGEASVSLDDLSIGDSPTLFEMIRDAERRKPTSMDLGRADKDGRYKLTLMPGAWRVGFSLEGARTIRLVPGESLTVDSKR